MNTLELFQQETRRLHHQRVSFIHAAGIVVMLLFTILDALLVPASFSELFHCRLAAIGICGLLLVANSFDRLHRLTWTIGFSGYCTIGIVILLTVHRLDGITSPYYVGLIVAMTLYTALAPLTVIQTLISGYVLVGLYVSSVAFVDPLSPGQWMDLFNNLFFMNCFVLIAATQSWADTAARKRDFFLRASEIEAAEALDRQARLLEDEVSRRTEAQKNTEKQYKSLYEAITDDVVLLSPQGVVLQANRSYLRHFSGGSFHPGASMFDVTHSDDREKLRTALASVVAQESTLTNLHLTMIPCQGTTMETEISGTLLKRGETILGIQLILRNISARNLLERQLIDSLCKVRQTENAAILALAKLSEYRDITPGQHLERVREYSKALAFELARHRQFAAIITPTYIQDLYQGIILHDIGKVAVADEILAKRGPLSALEEETLRNHTLSGGDVIKAMEMETKGRSFLSLAKNIAYFHHERWDGQGYPYGLQGTEIPLESRIAALADAYEEWTAAIDREQRLPHHQAVDAIIRNAGHRFDPVLVDAFVVLQASFDRIRQEFAEPN